MEAIWKLNWDFPDKLICPDGRETDPPKGDKRGDQNQDEKQSTMINIHC